MRLGKLEIAKRSLGINRPFEVLELDFSGYAKALAESRDKLAHQNTKFRF